MLRLREVQIDRIIQFCHFEVIDIFLKMFYNLYHKIKRPNKITTDDIF